MYVCVRESERGGGSWEVRNVTGIKMKDWFDNPSAFVPLPTQPPSMNLAKVLTGSDTASAKGLR